MTMMKGTFGILDSYINSTILFTRIHDKTTIRITPSSFQD
jgi:hypothetical protein